MCQIAAWAFTIDGKSVTKSDFRKFVDSLIEITDSRTTATGPDSKGRRIWYARYKAQDSTRKIWMVQEQSTSKGIIGGSVIAIHE
jgi:hypothetical protein